MVTWLLLIVREGPDEEASARVGADPIAVGRARGNDLVLRDPSVSRRHLEARADGGAMIVRAFEGAAPFVVRGDTVREARLSPGQTLLVGDTVIEIVAEGTSMSSGRGETQRTDVRTLFDGASSEVRGLSALFQLTEALDRASDRAWAEEALRSFLVEHARAADMVVDEAPPPPTSSYARTNLLDSVPPSTSGSMPPARPPMDSAPPTDAGNRAALIQHTGAGITALVLPTGLPSPPSITVRLAASEQISDPLRRLLVVAARVFASRVAQLHALSAARAESESLRAIALGSARAFLGTSKAAEQVARVVPRLAGSDAVALLLGESGSGKTFVARLIHEASSRASEPLRVINCAAIPESLLEAELFGAERGAFTGAVAAREGAFEAAGNGTLLLDEIGELGLMGQAKLLRALEERRFERLGSNRSLALRARVLTATNRDLSAMVEAGTFRQDLFLRISVVTLNIPPLRERGDDIRLLSERILADLAPQFARRVCGFSPAALAAIQQHGWPGNVRELRNAIEHALVLGDGPLIEPADLPARVTLDKKLREEPPAAE